MLNVYQQSSVHLKFSLCSYGIYGSDSHSSPHLVDKVRLRCGDSLYASPSSCKDLRRVIPPSSRSVTPMTNAQTVTDYRNHRETKFIQQGHYYFLNLFLKFQYKSFFNLNGKYKTPHCILWILQHILRRTKLSHASSSLVPSSGTPSPPQGPGKQFKVMFSTGIFVSCHSHGAQCESLAHVLLLNRI